MKIKFAANQLLVNLTVMIVAVFLSFNAGAQISGGEVKPEKEKGKKEKKERTQRERKAFEADSLSGTAFYVTGMVQQSYRFFEDQSVYGIHALLNDEVPMITGGAGVGIVMPLSGPISLDAGLTYFGHGEAYNYEDPLSDSVFNYTNVYMQIGVPLKLRYTYGQDLQFFGTAGMTPLNILNIRRKEDYRTAEGVFRSPGLSLIKEGFSTFNVMATVGAGVNYYVNHFGFTLSMEYRRHLANTYAGDTFKRIHKMYGIGLNFGFQIRV